MDKELAERYKNEMMKLYGKRCGCDDDAEPEITAPERSPEIDEPEVCPDVTEAENELPDVIETEPGPVITEEERSAEETDCTETPEDFDKRFPEPDLSPIEENSGDETAHEQESDELGNSAGYILVNVRAGNEAIPIENAAVTVTAVTGGKRLLIAAVTTDSSGSTVKIEVPAPDPGYSQTPDPRVRPYSLFDITVKAEGCFDARSVDVPVFPGVTSIQNFSMVPVPLMMSEGSEILTYYNQEPYSGPAAEKRGVQC